MSETSKPIPRQTDASAFLLHFTGGLRAGQIDQNKWRVDPILQDGQPVSKFPLSTEQLQAFASQNKFLSIGFESINWTNGTYHSTWTPINPTKKNHALGPADIWRNISSNLTHARADKDLRGMTKPTREEITALLDNRTDAERLAQSISLSLRSVDISVNEVADFYNEQLVNLMVSGTLNGRRHSSSRDQTLYAYVHSFFLHLGAARDYLAAFIASELGRDPSRVDSLARLARVITEDDFKSSKILQLMKSEGFLTPAATGQGWHVVGWLGDMSKLRNQHVHKRPYGLMHDEKMGHARVINEQKGLYRYFRPIVLEDRADQDLMDVLSIHYRHSIVFFFNAAQVSGFNPAIPSISDKDIISFQRGGS